MNTIKTSKCEIMIVKLPDDASHVEMKNSTIVFHDKTTRWANLSKRFIPIPEGFTHLIPDIFNPSEEDAKMVVESFEEPKGWINYVDYVDGGKETNISGVRSIVIGCNTATASFATLIEKEGYSRVNPLSEPADYKQFRKRYYDNPLWKPKHGINGGDITDEIIAYEAAQQKSGRFAAIIKIIKQ